MFRRFAANTQGAVLVLTAIVLSFLIASTALGIEVGGWYLTTRHMQGASDAAAISAAASYVAGEAGYQSVGYSYASKNGFCDKSHVSPCDPNSKSKNVTVTVSAVTNNKIRVDIWDAPQPWFVPAVWKLKSYGCGNDSTDQYACLHVHSIVSLHSTPPSGNGCLLGLNKTQTDLIVGGNGAINAPKCVAASDTCGGANPPCAAGFVLNGAPSVVNLKQLIVATPSPYVCPAGTVGKTCILGSSTTTYPLWTPDPFATVVMPNPGACPGSDPQPSRVLGVTVYSPGTYCAGISISGANTIAVFNPGTYFLGATNNAAPSNFSITGGFVNQWTVTAFNATPVTAGTGYKKNDVLKVTGNGITASNTWSDTFIKVTSVNGKTGAITGFSLTASGAYSGPLTQAGAVTVGVVDTTTPAATGATFNLTFANNTSNPVQFILTGPTGADVGGSQIKNAAVNLTAPSPLSGSASGSILFWQDCYPKSTSCVPSSGGIFNGNGQPSTNMTLDGAIYFPHQTVTIAGNSIFLPTQCTSMVADIIDFQGNGSIQNGCLPFGSGGGGSGNSYSLTE
jgi:hypothetical protein